MRAEMQHGVGRKIVPEITVEGREGVRRREALLEEQPHRVALIAKGRLDADKDVAELPAQYMDRRAIALLTAGRRTPLRLDLVEIALTANMILHRNAHMDIGKRAEPRCIAAG